jgi:8-oxo-dGTP diphosphatase
MEINGDDVDRRLARLEAEWGSFPVDHREDVWSAEEFADSVALAEDGYTGGAHVLAVRRPGEGAALTESMPDHAEPEADRVLLVLGRGGDAWGPPGGGREGEETSEAAAVREVREETSVDVSLTGVREALRWTTTAEGDDRTVHTLFVRFDGRYEGGHVTIQPGELNGAAWFRELPANLHEAAERFAADWDGGQAGG